MMSMLVTVSSLGLVGCGSAGSSETGADKVRMLTPEELSEVQSVQDSVQSEEKAHFSQLAKGVRPSR